MSPWSALLQRGEDRGTWILFFLFVVLPLLARLVRWLGERAGVVRPQAGQGQREDPREALRRRRAERRAAEEEGEEAWKRLARGAEAPAPPPAPWVVAPREAPFEPGDVVVESLEREEEAAPLAMMGTVVEPSEGTAVSLEREEEPLPLAMMGTVLPAPGRGRPVAARRILGTGPTDWRRAIVLSEVLGPPVSERRGA